MSALTPGSPVPPGSFAFEMVPQAERGESMHFLRPVSDVIDELAQAGPYQPTGFWAPARLLRFVMNRVTGHDRPEMVREAAGFALEAYATGNIPSERLETIASRIGQLGLLKRKVEQTYDQTSLAAGTPERSRAAAERLLAKAAGPLLIIGIGHGGTLPAMQGALYHERYGGDSIFYPIRFSRTKAFDFRPKVAREELEYLRRIMVGRTVVVYDDDARSGKTVARSIAYLRRQNIVGDGLLGVVNWERRSQRRIRRQGEWWEHV